MGNRRIMGLVALLAVALVLLVRQSPLPSDIDATDYHDYYLPAADSIRSGHGITIDGTLATRYPPGYPLLLATASVLPGGDATEVTVVNAVSLAASGVLLFLLMRRMGSRAAAVIGAFGIVTYPLLVYSAAAPSTELPFIALLLGATLLAVKALTERWWMAAAAGGLVGAAALVRPAGAAVGLVLALLIIAWRRDRGGLVLAVVLVAMNLVVISPWELWVHHETGEVIALGTVGPSTAVSGLTLVGRNEAGGRTIAVPQSVDDLGRRAARDQAQLATSGDVLAFLREEADRSPSAVAILFAFQAARSWYGTDSLRYEGAILLIQLPYLALAGVGAWAARRKRLVGLSFAMIGYFWLTTIAAVSIVRYLLPGMVFVVALAATGTDRILATRRAVPVAVPPRADVPCPVDR